MVLRPGPVLLAADGSSEESMGWHAPPGLPFTSTVNFGTSKIRPRRAGPLGGTCRDESARPKAARPGVPGRL
eukprot:768288-Hanusia_phi.AAC.1